MVDETTKKRRDFTEIVQDQNDRAERIGKTDSGERFLDRIRQIGQPRPLREAQDQGE